MRILSVFYYIAALVLLVFLMSQALPFLENLLPGVKLIYVIFPVFFLLLTHFKGGEIIRAFKMAGHKTKGSQSELRQALLFFKTMQHLFTGFILLGIPVFFIWFLATPQSTPPRIAHIAAMIVTAFFYPLFFILFLCLPCKSAIEKKLIRHPSADD